MIKYCDVCGSKVEIDDYNNGRCKNCGWNNVAPDVSEVANYPNMLSLSDAKIAYKNGKRLLPSFGGFLEILSRGFEMVIWYKTKKYGAMLNNKMFDFYLWNSNKNFQEYNTIDEFAEKANINGVPLRDLWKDIVKIEYDC